MTLHRHVLKGCAPAPLAHYLKALGILRLVGDQADPEARGWWVGERFCLLSKLSKEELEAFFLEKYEPTPLVAPWNGGSGFFKKGQSKDISALVDSPAKRFEPFHEAIRQATSLLNGMSVKPEKQQKLDIQRDAVLQWRGPHQDWLAAAFVLDESREPTYPSLLGTGEMTDDLISQTTSCSNSVRFSELSLKTVHRLLVRTVYFRIRFGLMHRTG